MMDAARLADELRVEQEFAQTQEKAKKALDNQIKELHARIEVVEGEHIGILSIRAIFCKFCVF